MKTRTRLETLRRTADGRAATVAFEGRGQPLLERGGVVAVVRREVLPYTPDAWMDATGTKVGYEISFTRHFDKPQPLRSLDAIRRDILAVEKETEGLLGEIVGGKR